MFALLERTKQKEHLPPPPPLPTLLGGVSLGIVFSDVKFPS